MKYLVYVGGLTVYVFLFSLAFPQKAYAYLDPGTGSLIIQVLIAGLVGGLFALKLFWRKTKAFFSRAFSRKKRNEGGLGSG